MSYTQLVLRRVSHDRAQRGEKPVFGLDLMPHERIVGVEHYGTIDTSSRVTVDHYATVWIAVDLGEPSA